MVIWVITGFLVSLLFGLPWRNKACPTACQRVDIQIWLVQFTISFWTEICWGRAHTLSARHAILGHAKWAAPPPLHRMGWGMEIFLWTLHGPYVCVVEDWKIWVVLKILSPFRNMNILISLLWVSIMLDWLTVEFWLFEKWMEFSGAAQVFTWDSLSTYLSYYADIS